jgi:hypothetical protein
MALTAAKRMASQVDMNFDAFIKVLPDLLRTHPGKFALMHNGEVVEFLDSLSDAVLAGAAKFGDSNFSVQEVVSQNINLGFHLHAVHQLST